MTCNAIAVLLSLIAFAVGWVAGFATHTLVVKIDSEDDQWKA